MYSIQPVFTNMYGGDNYKFSSINLAYNCAKLMLDEDVNIMYVDISNCTFFKRMYRKTAGNSFGFKNPWELPKDEEGVGEWA